MYDMILKFKLTLGLKDFNKVLESMLLNEKAVIEDGLVFRLRMKLPQIPDEQLIQKYAEIIKKGYESEKFSVEKCKFDGFEKIKENKNEKA